MVEYKVENLSPVKTRVDVTVPAEEVDAAIGVTASKYKNKVQMDGFRKGKVPTNLIKKRFHNEILDEARQSLFNANLNEIIEKLDAHPVSGIVINGEESPLESGKDFKYSLEFEVLPEIKLPTYTGLEVEQVKTVPNPTATEDMIKQMREMSAKLKPVEGLHPAVDGQIANISFEGFEKDSETPYIKITDFDLALGDKAALPEFEELVKGIPVGNTAEKDIQFPDNFIDPKLAGKTLKMKVTVNAVKEKDYSEFDKKIADSKEAYENLAKSLQDSYEKELTQAHKAAAETKLIDQLLKQTDFPVPESFIEFEQNHILAEWDRTLAQQGKNLSALGKTNEELLADTRPQAETNARRQTLLMTIAKDQKLEVTDQEVAQHIYESVLRSRQNYKDVVESMRNNGLIYRLRDRMLADKGMDYIYENAKITMVEPEKKAENAAE